jgi:integrase
MKPFSNVRVWDIQDRRSNPRFKRPWLVRWTVEGREFSRSHRTRSEADRRRSALLAAVSNGERFSMETGEPVSWNPADDDPKIHTWVRRWLAEQWPEWQPRTRASAVEAIARFVHLAVKADASRPPASLRKYLIATLPPSGAVGIGGDDEAWLNENVAMLSDLDRQSLALVDSQLGLGDDGRALAPSTAGRYRKIARACVRRAVDLEVLASDPWPLASRGRSRRRAVRVKRSIDVRSLPNPATMARAIDAIVSHQPSSHKYRVMTAIAYYGGLRPSEVVMLRKRSFVLPATGWGRIDVTEADVDHDEPGEPKTGPRTVPVPPVLVSIVSSWLDEAEFADDDLIFRTRNDNRPTASNWRRAWHRALASIGEQPLRIYDCRHAAATTWLQAGVPLGVVARRLGHSVSTLVSTYVGAIAGDDQIANDRIDASLADHV